MVYAYCKLIKAGSRTIDDVPLNIREEVRAKLALDAKPLEV